MCSQADDPTQHGDTLRAALLRIFDMAEDRPDIREVARAALASSATDEGPRDTYNMWEDFPDARPAVPALDDAVVAMLFHETYERLAPSFGYETRPESAVPWADVPEQNRALMTAVVHEVRAALAASATDEGRVESGPVTSREARVLTSPDWKPARPAVPTLDVERWSKVRDNLDVIDGIVDDTHPEGDGCPLCHELDNLREIVDALRPKEPTE